MLERRPVWHEVGVGDQDSGCLLMGFKNPDGFARLNKQRLVGLKRFE